MEPVHYFRSHNWALSWVKIVQAIPSHPQIVTSVLMVSSYLSRLASNLCLLSSPAKRVYHLSYLVLFF